ncbi:MAG: SMP-30/gluconolactonase/LRE family protein [Acidobacteriota bacterium]|nr:SMP-30/gluconolactonase/LRE family protein [Acidobacteriota bacterium]
MRRWVVAGLAVAMMSCGGASEPVELVEPESVPSPSAGAIERLDPAFDELVSADAVIEHLADGFGFTEGPVWVDEGDGYLLFSDIPGNTIVKWEPDGTVSDFLSPVYEGDYEEGRLVGSNGITVDPSGEVVFTEHFNGRISRVAADGTRSVVVDSYEGGRLNSPNDLDYHSDGSLYFTDPAYGLPTPEDRAQEVNGVYRLSAGGELTRLVDQEGPNGVAFSPDESRLYVADSLTGQWMSYDVTADGALSEPALLLDTSGAEESGAADGLKVDERGNLWATGPGGVWVISPDGRHLGTIKPTEVPANVAFGNADRRTLYMTARTGLYRIRVNVAGDR